LGVLGVQKRELSTVSAVAFYLCDISFNLSGNKSESANEKSVQLLILLCILVSIHGIGTHRIIAALLLDLIK